MRRTLSAFALATTCAVLTACGGGLADNVTSQQAPAAGATDAGDMAEPSIAAPTPYTPKSAFDGLDSSGLKSVAAINWPQTVGDYSQYTSMAMPTYDMVYAPADVKLLSDVVRITIWEGTGADDPVLAGFFGPSLEAQGNVVCKQDITLDYVADCGIVLRDGWLQVISLPSTGDLSFAYTWSKQLYDAL